MSKDFVISGDLVVDTIEYLAKKPYKEVVQLIEALRAVKLLEDKGGGTPKVSG